MASKKKSPVEIVAEKYKKSGWTVLVQSGGINDIVCTNETKLHFVLCFESSGLEEPRLHGLAKNNFVQNAFSNKAAPIFAEVGPRGGITLKDVNEGKEFKFPQDKKEQKKPEPKKAGQSVQN